MNSSTKFKAPISREIWELKYRLKDPDGTPIDQCLDDTLWRVANTAASIEKGGRKKREFWADRFFHSLNDLGFIPAGRILAGAGSGRKVTLFNCFVMGTLKDDLSGIFNSVKRAALTMQTGGGIGVDFSPLRPKGALVKSVGAGASGPVSFMGVWDAMCQTIQSAGARRGAMMATLRADHPDIEQFIEAKHQANKLTNFNLSVLATDAFMEAVQNDKPWDLVFEGKVFKTLRARDLWDRLMRATYDAAEPGVIFIDRVNAQNNLSYCETINATNPCGEQPLPPFGACLLGSLNLAQLVRDPFTSKAHIDISQLRQRVQTAVRLLDNMIDISHYPLRRQKQEAKAKRRMGIGMTGLADALIMCAQGYGTKAGTSQAEAWMAAIQNAAYAASAQLAKEKGPFPLYNEKSFLSSPNVARLSNAVRAEIKKHGLRNGCLTSIAPTGTISLLAGNVSSGIEPVFDFTAKRTITQQDATYKQEIVEDYALTVFRNKFGPETPLPEAFVRAADLSPRQHLDMQAALQPFVDSAISKTINCPEDLSFENFKDVYQKAYALGLKGCTTYRPSPMRGAVLKSADKTVSQTANPQKEEVLKGPARLFNQTGTIQQTKDPDATIVYMAKPLEREQELHGITYKLKWPQSDHAIYVTINDIELDGRRRPFEIFINTRNLEHYSWTVALTRMISAVFRRGGDVSFVAEELKAVFDPQGGCWIKGRYVPSLLAAIGEVIETHMHKIGFSSQDEHAHKVPMPNVFNAEQSPNDALLNPDPAPGTPQNTPSSQRARLCQRCSSGHLIRRESCWQCPHCGFSQCD